MKCFFNNFIKINEQISSSTEWEQFVLGINFYKGIVFNFMAQSLGSQREYVKGHLSVSTQCNEPLSIIYVLTDWFISTYYQNDYLVLSVQIIHRHTSIHTIYLYT